MLIAETIKLVGFTLGALLHLSLLLVFRRSWLARARERLILLTILSAALWHSGNALGSLYGLLASERSAAAAVAFDVIAIAGVAFLPSLLLHVHLAFYVDYAKAEGAATWLAILFYLPLLALPFALKQLLAAPFEPPLIKLSHLVTPFAAWLSLALVVSAALDSLIAARAEDKYERTFFRSLALIFSVIAAVTGYTFIFREISDAALRLYLEPLAMISSIVPTAFVAYYIYRFNLLELLIRRRFIYVLSASLLIALYLIATRRISDYLDERYGLHAPLLELIFMLATIAIAFPIYFWINSLITKRIKIYNDFARIASEQASSILSLGPRLDFLAREVKRIFALRRASIVTLREDPQGGFELGPASSDFDVKMAGGSCSLLASLLSQARAPIVRASDLRAGHPEQSLKALGYTHAFPLWYENRLTGLLLIDPSPRKYLEDDEGMLQGIANQIAHSIENCRMIEEKIRLEKALLAQEHMAGLGRMAATIAHEIKNPLSAIKTIVQLMLEDANLADEYQKDLSYINSEIDRLSDSVTQLLKFSRPAPEAPAATNLSQIAKNMIEFLAGQYAQAQVRIEAQIEPDLTIDGIGPEGVKEILLNLLLNAMQASPPSGKVKVHAYKQGENGAVVLEVADQGPGVPPHLREKIFEPFFTTKQKGTGLGLSIVKKNVEHIGGKVKLQSPIEDGRGAKFTVFFPICDKP